MATHEATTALDAALRAWAKGMYPLEAGVELLVRSGWAARVEQSGFVEWSENKRIAWPKVGDFLLRAGYLSGGERRQVTIIVSFLGQDTREGPDDSALPHLPVRLYEDLPGVDRRFVRLVQSAVGHAAGMHESGGNPLPWPEAS